LNFNNPPAKLLKNITHKTFYSNVLDHEIGYNIYLPPDYDESGKQYPVAYHIHGWKGNESSEIEPMEKVYRDRQAITVFINAISSENDYFEALMQMEAIFVKELIPHIDKQYRTSVTHEKRMLSGFSMGGMIAFYYAVRYPELFGSVTPYAGTYHHQFHKNYPVQKDWLKNPSPEIAKRLFESMIREERYLEENNILCMVRQNADKIRGSLHIDIHIGTDDILFCDNEIIHLFLTSLNISHEYKKYNGIGHELIKIL
jgi:enterochelin esterase-like enzyme